MPLGELVFLGEFGGDRGWATSAQVTRSDQFFKRLAPILNPRAMTPYVLVHSPTMGNGEAPKV